MTKKLTRRQFLELSGKVLVASGIGSTLLNPTNQQIAHAEGVVELDGREMVAKVGDTFATIQLVPYEHFPSLKSSPGLAYP